MILRLKKSNRPGAAAVEFAIVLPILLLLITGIWEVGRMIEATQVLSNAAREGVRCAAAGNKTVGDVDLVVFNYIKAAGFTTTGYTMKVYNLTANPTPLPSAPSDDPSTAAQLDHLRVYVTLPFNNVKWVFLSQITNVTTLKSQADWVVMRDQPLVVDSTMPY